MVTNEIYLNFEDWFDERESFDLRSDRFFNQLNNIYNQADQELFVRRWMEAAWEQGRRSMLWENA